MTPETRHGVRSVPPSPAQMGRATARPRHSGYAAEAGTKLTKFTKAAKLFVILLIFVAFVPERELVALRSDQQAAQQRQAITSTTTAILVDAVVRDRNGHPLTDLSANDFELFEDGA